MRALVILQWLVIALLIVTVHELWCLQEHDALFEVIANNAMLQRLERLESAAKVDSNDITEREMRDHNEANAKREDWLQ